MKRTMVSLAALSLVLATHTSGIAENPADYDAAREVGEQVERIKRYDDGEDGLNAVITYSYTAGFKAREMSDVGILRGRTVLVKDNIETQEFPTTAGSLALRYNFTRRDAPLISNLRKAGGVVLGKANLSEWANIRSNNSTSGWSAVGGLTRNPHDLDRNACGSSSGSAAAVAAGFAWGAIGTETNGSITCPASVNGIVGFKPSVGIVSRRHIVPISSTQDTAGPMTRTVHDAALLLSAIAGEDLSDPATVGVPRVTDYSEGLDSYSLEGIRIGVMRQQAGNRDDVKAIFNSAIFTLKRAGATIVEIDFEPNREMYRDSFTVLMFELREEMDKYLQSIPEFDDGDTPRSLADIVQFNKDNSHREMRWFGQDIFHTALETTDRAAYEKARENAVRIAGEETLDKLMAENDVQFLVAPTTGPAWTTDLVNGDSFARNVGFGSPAAIAGYPHLTLPMGYLHHLPVGLSIIGPKWADHDVLKAGAAYEKARTQNLPTPQFKRWSSEG